MFTMIGSRVSDGRRIPRRVPLEIQSVVGGDSGGKQVTLTFPKQPMPGNMVYFFVTGSNLSGANFGVSGGNSFKLAEFQDSVLHRLAIYQWLVQKGDNTLSWTFGQAPTATSDICGMGVEVENCDNTTDVTGIIANAGAGATAAQQIGLINLKDRLPAIEYVCLSLQSAPTTLANLGPWLMRSAVGSAGTHGYFFRRLLPVYPEDPYDQLDFYTVTGQPSHVMTQGLYGYGGHR